MIHRGQNTEEKDLNIVGSSTFGKYPKISVEKTVNMFMSDQWMVPYAGYITGIPAAKFNNALQGRALHTSIKFGKLVGVFDNMVYLISITFDQNIQKVTFTQVVPIGQLQTSTGVVYISENNKPQICISDGQAIYIYDPTLSPPFQTITTNFTPGFIDFHDTYFLCAASGDNTFSPPANNTWRLSAANDGTSWPDTAAFVGELQTKPDNTKAVVRFPSKGNMIFVFGSVVTEPWFDVAYQLFPYQRNTNFNIDYGCINPATIASIDELVVWLAINEKAGVVIMYSDGGMPERISTDGIDYVLSNLANPEDSQGFIYRQDGHIFYHVNFYSDNLSLFIDFLPDGTKKIYHATDENGDYFIASSVALYQNQYYFISKNNGNLYVFDTIFYNYDGVEIPRDRYCKNIRNKKQEPFIANDCGFTIESGNTNYNDVVTGPIYLITQDGKKLITEGGVIFFQTENGNFLTTQNDDYLVSQQVDNTNFFYLIAEQPAVNHQVPHVDLAISIDGGEHFSSLDSQFLPPIGQRKNKLQWWQLGWANDMVCHFRFHGLGRFVVTDGTVNIRQ